MGALIFVASAVTSVAVAVAMPAVMLVMAAGTTAYAAFHGLKGQKGGVAC